VISERTRLALGAKKATGARLGNARNLNEAGALGRRTLASEADRLAANVLPIVQELRAAGLKALGAIAAALSGMEASVTIWASTGDPGSSTRPRFDAREFRGPDQQAQGGP